MKPGYAGQRADVGGGAGGARTGGTGAGSAGAVQDRNRYNMLRGEGRKDTEGKTQVFITQSSSPNLGYHLSGFTNIMITNVTIPNRRF